MAVKTANRRTRDTYFELIKQFPLTRIRDDAHLTEAHTMIDLLLQRKLDDSEEQYLDVLTGLVADFEDDRYIIPDAPEADVLRELMHANGYSQPKLAKR